MKINIITATLLFAALCVFAAEDVTETTPLRIAPAVGLTTTPLAVGYRVPLADHYSIDLMLRIPEFSSNEDGGSGIEFGGVAGYNIPIRLEENIAFVVKPQIDLSYSTESFENDSGSYSVNTFSLRPGAFTGIEIFMEEIGVPNVNIALGFTTGMEYNIISSDDKIDDRKSTFHIPVATSPFGATVGIWWFF
ncbi:hypothetical protein J7L01_02580 [bacterium]|nr:hypothetical protein [bacterium]